MNHTKPDTHVIAGLIPAIQKDDQQITGILLSQKPAMTRKGEHA